MNFEFRLAFSFCLSLPHVCVCPRSSFSSKFSSIHFPPLSSPLFKVALEFSIIKMFLFFLDRFLQIFFYPRSSFVEFSVFSSRREISSMCVHIWRVLVFTGLARRIIYNTKKYILLLFVFFLSSPTAWLVFACLFIDETLLLLYFAFPFFSLSTISTFSLATFLTLSMPPSTLIFGLLTISTQQHTKKNI